MVGYFLVNIINDADWRRESSRGQHPWQNSIPLHVTWQHLPFSPVSLIDSEKLNEKIESVLCWIKEGATTCGGSSQTCSMRCPQKSQTEQYSTPWKWADSLFLSCSLAQLKASPKCFELLWTVSAKLKESVWTVKMNLLKKRCLLHPFSAMLAVLTSGHFWYCTQKKKKKIQNTCPS